MKTLADLKIKIFADGADKAGMLSLYGNTLIKGMTTNPSLMRKAGITDYEAFAKDILQTVKDKPISLEVFTDEFDEMRKHALKISNTRRESSLPLIKELAQEGVRLNITAILTLEQVSGVAQALNPSIPSVVSVFAGRIADTGVDPAPIMRASRALLAAQPKAELLWASVREVLNIFQADACGCDIVTVPFDILSKAIKMYGMDLSDLSLDTVKMFASDAAAAGYKL